MREIRRRLADVEDRTRYLIVSPFTGRFKLYYNVSTDSFALNDPTAATLFKRRSAAAAIQRLLRGQLQILRCRVDRRERLVKRSVPRVRSWPTRRRGVPIGPLE